MLQSEITLIREEEGSFSAKLYKPLRKLGQILLEAKAYHDSLNIFREMQSLIHRHDGVMSPLQHESVDFLIEAYIGLGEFSAIDQQQLFRWTLFDHNYDDEEMSKLQAHAKLADWYRDTHRYRDAMALYARSRTVLEKNPDQEPALISVLRAEALTMYLAGKCCASDKLRVAAERIESADWADLSEKQSMLRDLEDLMALEGVKPKTVSQNSKTANPTTPVPPAILGFRNERAIQKAYYQTLTRGSNTQITIYEPVSSATTVLYSDLPQLPPAIGSPLRMCTERVREFISADNLRDLGSLSLDVSMTLGADGVPSDIQLNGSTPVALKRYFRQLLQAGNYRPAVVNGEKVAEKLTFTQYFAPAPLTNTQIVSTTWSNILMTQSCQRLEARA